MHRAPTILVLGFGLLSFAVACSDGTTDVTAARSNGIKRAIVDPSGTLDKNINDILALLPKGLETAATTRWSNVKAKYYAGLTDPAQAAVAKQMLFELSDWVSQKAPGMADPPNSESKSAAAARAVLYMSMFVYGGPDTKPPAFMPLADAAFGVVTPSAPATIVTPTTHAGVQLEAGSVAENTIVIVTENPTPYPDNCSGPLQTKLCQYPQFYSFEEFPHKALLKPGKFNVCHVNSGTKRAPLADHDRFRLAHTKPDDPADYTPGSTILDQNGESIEILPLVSQTFSTCGGSFYAQNDSPLGSLGGLSRFASGVKRFLTPKTAYAIDVGLGGLSKSMSAFNDVDSLGRPDLLVQSASVAPASVPPGGHVALSFVVKNIGTATRNGARVKVWLTAAGIDGAIAGGQQLGSALDVGALPPDSVVPMSQVDIALPSSASAGAYTLSVVADDDPAFSDADPSNNAAAIAVSVRSVVINLGVLPGDIYSEATAVNSSGQVVGFSGDPSSNATHSFIWQNGVMTNLGVTGGIGSRATAINDSGYVAGVILLAGGGEHAFRWHDGVTTDLGTLPGTSTSAATGINLGGRVVGGNFFSQTHAWSWDGGPMVDLGVLPGNGTFATAINDVGQIVGYSTSGTAQGWLLTNGAVTFLGGLGGGDTQPLAINSAGDVVGAAGVSLEATHPFLWRGGTITDLGTLGGNGYANGISDDGRVVGVSFLPSGVNHAFLWTNGSMTDLGTLGGDYSTATAIKNGRVVGNAVTAGGSLRAALWDVGNNP